MRPRDLSPDFVSGALFRTVLVELMLKRIRDLFGRTDKASSPAGDGGGAPDVEIEPALPAAAPRFDPPAVHHGPSAVHRPIPLSELDPDAVKILRRLTRFDHTAYLVGGCVRDLLLDRRPKDFDIATSATPRQVKRLFSNCRIIGRRFRLAHIYFQSGKIIEVATFRARDEGEPGEASPEDDLLIRDDNVFGSPEEDALRRDFTINALFYDVNAETVLDHVDGLGDLRRRLVRTIGEPGIRFREDPIRILRAIKFAARLGLEIEATTLEALRQQRSEIPKAASARVLEEINRFCRGGAARASFDLLRDTGVLEVILPEIADAYRDDPTARDLLAILLDRIDERLREGRDATTGEILATLLLPVVAPQMGWGENGRVAPPQGNLQVRDLADGILRPMSLRLRIARKDQEACRQILMVLARLAPVRTLRRGARESLARRSGFLEALSLLETIAHTRAGDLAEAATVWREYAPAAGAGRPVAAPRGTNLDEASTLEPARATEAEPDGPAQRRRRRRRSRRGGRGAGRELPETTTPGAVVAPPHVAAPHATPPGPQPRVNPERRPDLPPPWDDRYFFAALPTAGPAEAYDDVRDHARDHALDHAVERAATPPEVVPKPDDESAPARPRRRRSRSRRGSRGRGSTEGDTPGDTPGSAES